MQPFSLLNDNDFFSEDGAAIDDALSLSFSVFLTLSLCSRFRLGPEIYGVSQEEDKYYKRTYTHTRSLLVQEKRSQLPNQPTPL